MPKSFSHYSILISCPSDVLKDKQVIQNAVDTVNLENAHYLGLHFDIRHWSKDVLFSHGTPQDIINNSIVYDSDIVIALFGSKLGTPTDKYASGTIEEIELMIKENKQIFVCFSEKEIIVPGDSDEETLENLIKVKRFKRNYKGLYITYKNDNELKIQIQNQLRLFLNRISLEDRSDVICDIPFTYQELQGHKECISKAKEVIFCARTGKIFLTGHYNHIKELINNGGQFCFITSEDLNLYNDCSEHEFNQNNSLRFVENLKKLRQNAVECKILKKPVNNTLLYIKMEDDSELIEIKFNFQSIMDYRHPMFRIKRGNPYFDIFYTELTNLKDMAETFEISRSLS